VTVSDTYVCSVCRGTTERPYGVRYVVATCPDCGRHGRLVHESLVALLAAVPEADRPDDWDDRPLDERLLDALDRGFISIRDTRI
jgi:DNA-directed RNA polymerase subunit RPC12/RpoP